MTETHTGLTGYIVSTIRLFVAPYIRDYASAERSRHDSAFRLNRHSCVMCVYTDTRRVPCAAARTWCSVFEYVRAKRQTRQRRERCAVGPSFTAGRVSPCAWRHWQHSGSQVAAHAPTRSVSVPPAPGPHTRIPPPGSWHPSLHAPPFALRVAVAGRVAHRVKNWALVRLVSGSRALGRFVPMQYSAVSGSRALGRFVPMQYSAVFIPRYRLFAASPFPGLYGILLGPFSDQTCAGLMK